jgi:hypothetical protein
MKLEYLTSCLYIGMTSMVQLIIFSYTHAPFHNRTKQTITHKANDYPTKQTFTFEAVRYNPKNKKNPP